MIFELRPNIQAVIYRRVNNKKEFLLMHRIKNWSGWEFVKGGVKPGETPEEAVSRELKEEANISPEDIMTIWKTHFNTIITYPKNISKKQHYSGSLNKTYIVEVKISTNAKIPKNSEEHSELRWVKENQIKKYLYKGLLTDFSKIKRIVAYYSKVYNYGINVQKIFKNRLIGILLYGSATTATGNKAADYDLVVILKNKARNDIQNLRKANIKNLCLDLQLKYLTELPFDSSYLSWDSATSYYYYVISDAIPIIGDNPIKKMRPPGSIAYAISILSKTQYNVYKMRQAVFENRKDLSNYFRDRLPIIMRRLIKLHGYWYDNPLDAINDFSYFFPTAIPISEISKIRHSIENNIPLPLGKLHSIYEKLYEEAIKFLTGKNYFKSL